LWGLAASDTRPAFPTESTRITSYFDDDHPYGIDIGALDRGVPGDPVHASMSGTVTRAGVPEWSSSTYIDIDGDDGRTYRYLHTDIGEDITEGTRVTTGQQIATMSDNGSPGQVHLHYEVFENGARIDPLSLFPDI
jgi:murein DD-endopeptidase MepM/ murein hydrolase activator NlpD